MNSAGIALKPANNSNYIERQFNEYDETKKMKDITNKTFFLLFCFNITPDTL